MNRRALRAAALGSLAARPGWAASRARIAPWGFDLAGMDRSVRPGDDFARYAGGTWMRTTAIPPDRTSWGPFFSLRADAERDVREIIEAASAAPGPPGSDGRRIADTYRAYLDVAAIARAGLSPLSADLAQIGAARTHEEVAALMARPDLPLGGPLSISPWPDARDPDRYAMNIVQSGLSLPDRDYYLTDDRRFAEVREAFGAYVAAMLALAGVPSPEAAAQAVAALETEIARRQWPRDKRNNRDLTYHPMSRAGLKAFAPAYPWDAALAAMDLPAHDLFVVKEDSAVQALTALFRATPVETWRAYMTFRCLNGMADILPPAFDDLAFGFNGRVLSGQPRPRERWRRAVSAVNAAVGEAVGRLYVARRFPPAAKARITALVEDLRSAYAIRIRALDWMSDATKAAALDKLSRLRVKVGYPDRWRDYSGLETRADDPVGNRKRALAWDWRRRVARLGQPTDRDEWGMTPQTLNAYYNAFFNEIVFPAAIQQPPYFDPAADPAVNFGGIGGVIGHEMGHAFDDQGAKTDGRGAQRDWWSPADAARFKALTGRLVEQYAAYEPIPGRRIDGRSTLGENIGDNGGLRVALEAYRLSLRGGRAPRVGGFTGEQRFFLSWAQTYREVIRDAQLRQDLVSDPHSPSVFRVNGVVRNIDAWYRAFDVRPGDRLYLAPGARARIW